MTKLTPEVVYMIVFGALFSAFTFPIYIWFTYKVIIMSPYLCVTGTVASGFLFLTAVFSLLKDNREEPPGGSLP